MAVSLAMYGSYSAAEDRNEDDNDNVVVVTAQKRTERLSEVPIAISVFSNEAIDQTGVQELREIGELIPNVLITQGTDFNSRILIRGVGAPSRNIGFDSRVGVYLDGVYLGQGPAVNQDLVDLERIEVLRGPQGTLFGKNTVAGAVSLVSVKPSDIFEASATVNVANYNGVEFKAMVNQPLNDSWSAKVAVSNRTRDGYVENVYQNSDVPTQLMIGLDPNTGAPTYMPLDFYITYVVSPQFEALGFPPFPTAGVGPTEDPDTTEKLNDQDTQSWRAQLRYQPSDNLDINIAFDGLQSERVPVLGQNLTDAFASSIDRFVSGEDQVHWGHQGLETRDILGVSFDVNYEMKNGFIFRSITANRNTKIFYSNDTDYTAIDYLTVEYHDEYDQTTQEFQFISPEGKNLKYVLGLYHYNQDSHTYRDAIQGNAVFLFGNYPGAIVRNDGDVETKSTAMYMSGSYDFSDRLKAGFGFRYSKETKDVEWNLDGSFSGVFGIGSTPAGGYLDSREDTFFAPTLSLGYAVSDNTNMYIKGSTGFKSGGFNLDYITQADLDAGIEFDKETVVSAEVGVKTSLMDNRLTLNMAYFDTTYEDYQVNQFFDLGFDPITGTQLTAIRITNAAEVETSGVEIEANFKVSESLTLSGSIGTLDAAFSSFPGGSSVYDAAQGKRIPIDAKGNSLPGAADLNAAIGIQYYTSLPSMGSDLLIRLDVTHTGDYYTTVENEKERVVDGLHPLTAALDLQSYGIPHTVPFGHVDAYSLVSGRIGLIDNEGSWEVYLWGRNLTDERQPVDSFREFFGTLVVTPQTPRTYGIEATYHF